MITIINGTNRVQKIGDKNHQVRARILIQQITTIPSRNIVIIISKAIGIIPGLYLISYLQNVLPFNFVTLIYLKQLWVSCFI